MPVRTCVGCRKRAEKTELVRIVATPGGPKEDPKAVEPGRGAYVCPGGECMAAAVKKGSLARALKRKN